MYWGVAEPHSHTAQDGQDLVTYRGVKVTVFPFQKFNFLWSSSAAQESSSSLHSSHDDEACLAVLDPTTTPRHGDGGEDQATSKRRRDSVCFSLQK